MHKLIALDLDGTLLQSNHQISAQTIQLLAKLQQQGHHIVLATGRIFSSAEAIAKTIGLKLHLIGCNGAVVYREGQGFIRKQLMARQDYRDVMAIIKRHAIYYHLYDTHNLYCNQLKHTAMAFHKSLQHTAYPHVASVRVVNSVEEVLRMPIDVIKVSIINDGSYDFAAVRAEIDALGTVDHVMSNSYQLDMMAGNVNKWTGLQLLMKALQIADEAVIAFGDSPNDIEMIQHAGLGVAMAGAQADVKAAADIVALGNDQDGVYHVLREYFNQ